jgi:hypothetical protein
MCRLCCAATQIRRAARGLLQPLANRPPRQHPFSGFGVMARFFLTITLSRLLRVASFMSTVLPSPRPGCYR